MIFSGYNSRKVGGGKNFSFSNKFYIDNTQGHAEMGFSGSSTGEDVKFSFQSGRVIDPEGKYCNSYIPSGLMTLSGNINTGTYEYYIDDVLDFSLGTRNDFLINSFFVNTRDCFMDANINVFGEQHSISTTIPSSFRESGLLTGTITNNSYSTLGGFSILSGEIVQTSDSKYFEIDTSFPLSVNNSENIVIKNILFLDELAEIDMKLYGGFGEYENVFLLSGVL